MRPGNSTSFMSMPLWRCDGRRYAYTAQKDGGIYMAIEGVADPNFRGSPTTDVPVFSPDSSHYAYVQAIEGRIYYVNGEKKINNVAPEVCFVVLDGKAGLRFSAYRQ